MWHDSRALKWLNFMTGGPKNIGTRASRRVGKINSYASSRVLKELSPLNPKNSLRTKYEWPDLNIKEGE